MARKPPGLGLIPLVLLFDHPGIVLERGRLLILLTQGGEDETEEKAG